MNLTITTASFLIATLFIIAVPLSNANDGKQSALQKSPSSLNGSKETNYLQNETEVNGWDTYLGKIKGNSVESIR